MLIASTLHSLYSCSVVGGCIYSLDVIEIGISIRRYNYSITLVLYQLGDIHMYLQAYPVKRTLSVLPSKLVNIFKFN